MLIVADALVRLLFAEQGWIRTPSRTVNAALWVWYKYFAPERLDVEGMSEEQKKESEQRHKQASAKKWRKRKHMFIAAISFIAFSAFAIFIGILTLIFWFVSSSLNQSSK